MLDAGGEYVFRIRGEEHVWTPCLLYTSDAADDLFCVDPGGRRIIKKKTELTVSVEKNTE